jgi:GAF domain-containing protein
VVKKDNSADQISRFWTKIGLAADIVAVVSNSPLNKKTYKGILQKIQNVIPFEFATFYLYDDDKKDIREEVSLGKRIEPIDFVPFELGYGFTAWAAKQEKPVLLSNVKSQNRSPDKAIGSFLVIPIRLQKKLIGVISLGHSQSNFFRERDVKLLSILAIQMGTSIERMIYQQKLEKQNKELVKTQKMLSQAKERMINDSRLDAVRELSVSVNHEINNPLSVIIGNIQCLIHIEKNLCLKIVERLKRIENEALKIAEINRRLIRIDELVTETYIDDGDGIKMINIEKSSSLEK